MLQLSTLFEQIDEDSLLSIHLVSSHFRELRGHFSSLLGRNRKQWSRAMVNILSVKTSLCLTNGFGAIATNPFSEYLLVTP